MAYTTIAARIPRGAERHLQLLMHHEHLDKSAAARKVIALGLAEWRKQEALELIRRGKLTVSAAAKFAGMSIWEMLELIREKKISYIHISKQELEKELEILSE